jgi:hypothetical protein
MQLAALYFYRTLDCDQAAKSPQLMRGPLRRSIHVEVGHEQ